MVHRHHLSGRPAPGQPYSHPRLIVPLRQPDHVALHVALRLAGLEFPPAGASLPDFWRRRLAFQFRLLGAQGHCLTFRPAELPELAAVLDGEKSQ